MMDMDVPVVDKAQTKDPKLKHMKRGGHRYYILYLFSRHVRVVFYEGHSHMRRTASRWLPG